MTHNKRYLYDTLLMGLLIWVTIQDILLSLLYKVTGNSLIIMVLFYGKEVIFLILFIASLFKCKMKTNYFYILFLFAFLIIIYSMVSISNNIDLFSIIQAIRGLILLPGYVLIGSQVCDKNRVINFFTHKYLLFIFFSCIFGITELLINQFIDTRFFWTDTIGITRFMIDIKGQEGVLVNGLPGSFYGSYGGEYLSKKRLLGLWAHPLTAGYSLCLPLLFCINSSFSKNLENKTKIKYYIFSIIFSISLFLTYTRAIIIPTAIAIVFILFKKSKIFKTYFPLFIIIVFLLLVIKYDEILSYLYDGSTIGHIVSLISGFSQASIFGKGLATFGINSSIGTESMYVSVYGQMGIIGLATYLSFFVMAYCRLKRNKSIFADVMKIATVIFMFTGLISEQLLAYTSIMPYYLLLGVVAWSKTDNANETVFQKQIYYKTNKDVYINENCY